MKKIFVIGKLTEDLRLVSTDNIKSYVMKIYVLSQIGIGRKAIIEATCSEDALDGNVESYKENVTITAFGYEDENELKLKVVMIKEDDM